MENIYKTLCGGQPMHKYSDVNKDFILCMLTTKIIANKFNFH